MGQRVRLRNVLRVSWKSRGKIASILLVSLFLLWPKSVGADIVTNPATDTRDFGDDTHTSVVKALAPISGANGNDKTQSGGLINAGDAAFQKTHAGWNFNWDTAANQKTAEATFGGNYYAWVVSTRVTSGGGKTTSYFSRERGGAVLNITANYDVPKSTDTDTFSLHWIQAYGGMEYGKETAPTLDNPYNRTIPFYDRLPGARIGGSAGTLSGNPNAWFTDVPFNYEKEYEQNPIADLTFQVVLALDDKHTVGKNVVHDVTLLGGFEWGFTYTAQDTPPPGLPEPASFVMWLQCFAIGAVGCFSKRFYNRRRARTLH